ncbi:alpha/beta hydrolase [Natrialbaceae archaeon A-gly3]
MSDVLVPGARDVRATLEEPDAGSDAVVVACPPHPRHGGNRRDRRLRAVSETLVERSIACLRIDYGEWDEGYGEREDVRNAIRWAADQYGRVGVFGYSFGGSQAILASATVDREVSAVAALAPAPRLGPDLEAIAAIENLVCPVSLVYGERDETVEWESIIERARDLGLEVEGVPGDHFFVGQGEKIARVVGDFFEREL